MPLPSILDSCKRDLLTSEADLRRSYPPAMADRILRIREMYNYWLMNPTTRDREMRDIIMNNFGVAMSTAYEDLKVIHQLVPLISDKSREFHKARAEEMYMETFNSAREAGDVRTMASTTAAYSRYFNIDKEDDFNPNYELVKIQPFSPTLDVSVLGLRPIPDVYNHIARLTKELSREFTDIADVDYEDADLEEDRLFSPLND